MRRIAVMILATSLLLPLAGCHAGASPLGAYAAPRSASAAGARATLAEPDAKTLAAVALIASSALIDADDAYQALKLDTAAGRKFTPDRDAVVRVGLVPVVTRLEAASSAIATQLSTADSSPLASFVADFASRHPQAGEPVPAGAGAAELLYRVAQYRLKLSFLLEFAMRHGALASLPRRSPAPAPSQP